MSETRRGRNRRNFRLESLEGRNLLSVIKPTAVAAEKIVVPGPKTLVTTVNAVVAGLGASAPFYGGLPLGYEGFSGHGVARPFGNVLVGLEYLPTASGVGSTAVTNGSILLTTVRGGDQIRLSFTGTNQVKAHDAQSWSWTGTVNSGTGRFLGSTGTFFATGSRVGNAFGNFKLTLKITFNPAV
jgi:hypothetical protein